jgi:hypothetical protein
MFLFSEIHDWQGNPAVKQILVFPTDFLKSEFEKTFAKRIKRVGIENASDNGIGAVYKIRAVKTGVGSWGGFVRCGSTSRLLLAQDQPKDNALECLADMSDIWFGYIRANAKMQLDNLRTQVVISNL